LLGEHVGHSVIHKDVGLHALSCTLSTASPSAFPADANEGRVESLPAGTANIFLHARTVAVGSDSGQPRPSFGRTCRSRRRRQRNR
jgi:hypothetical protein